MNKKIILPFVAILVLAVAMVGAASADEVTTVDEIEVRGSIVDTDAGKAPAGATIVPGSLTDCTWDSYTFAAFWYDLDEDLWTETLKLDTAANTAAVNGPIGVGANNRVIDEDELVYTTVPKPQPFEVCEELAIDAPGIHIDGAETETANEDGDVTAGEAETCYNVVGWMAEKYIGVGGRADTIAKLLVEFEDDDKKTLSTGEEWDLGGGFSLVAQQIDLEGNKVWFQLNKNGRELDSEVIDTSTPQNSLYVYTEDNIGGVDDVPIFVAYADAVFRGTESNIVQVKYVWLMSNEAIEIDDGDNFGELEVTQADGTKVELKNDNSITLSNDDTVDIFENMKIKVADDLTTIRFYPYVEKTEPGTYEVRGSIVDTDAGKAPAGATIVPGSLTDCTWDSYTFAAFWYDLDEDLWTETLKLDTAANTAAVNGPIGVGANNRVIDEDELVYTTVPKPQPFEVCEELAIDAPGIHIDGAETETANEDGDVTAGEAETCYNVVGWMAEKYIGVGGRADTIAKLLVEFEDDDKKTLSTGEEWDLGGGFSLVAQQIDLEGNKVWFQLNKNGRELDSEVIDTSTPQNSLYVYTEDNIGGVDDVPIFVAYADAVFRGTESNIVQVKYVWLMSNEAIEIDDGDNFGELEVTQADGTKVELKNDNSITLSNDDTVDIFENMNIKVADDLTTIRFYPFVEKTIGGIVTPVEEETPIEVNETADVNVTPTAVVTPTPEEAASPVVTATAEDTTAAEETATPKTPGFEAVFAIAGLLAVAYLVLRQRE